MNDMERLGYYSDVRERVHINTPGLLCVLMDAPLLFFSFIASLTRLMDDEGSVFNMSPVRHTFGAIRFVIVFGL
jgi:hypothetical protein